MRAGSLPVWRASTRHRARSARDSSPPQSLVSPAQRRSKRLGAVVGQTIGFCGLSLFGAAGAPNMRAYSAWSSVTRSSTVSGMPGTRWPVMVK